METGPNSTPEMKASESTPEMKASEPEPTSLVQGGPTVAKEASKPKRRAAKREGPAPKRGPARPYRKLIQEKLDARIVKLQKRVDKAAFQEKEAKSFLERYLREHRFRTLDDQDLI
jgi:hypothetical protein